MTIIYGLCSCGSSPRGLPLTGVHVEGKIMDSVAQMSVIQYYVNDSPNNIECRYVFPLDSQSAVCGFEAEVDGRTVVAQVKEKEEARKEYKEAVARGDGAYLLEQDKPDVFEVLVGNIEPGSRVNIWITYLTELKTEADLSTRFFIPTAVAPRYTPYSTYSHIPYTCPYPWYSVFNGRYHLKCVRRWRRVADYWPAYTSQPGPSSFSILLEVEMPSKILSISSPSHSVDTDILADGNGRVAVIKFSAGSAPIGSDFVLRILQETPHEPRAMIEIDDDAPEVAAGMVTLLPDIELEDAKSELIFVVDRSGSMSGRFIREAKSAMQLFIRTLPSDCYFNIIGFGSRYVSLFGASEKYSERTMSQAIAHIDRIDADLGGTELFQPFDFIFRTPSKRDYARSVFVLTDGQVSNLDQVTNLIARNARDTRVFALGIGDQVSHALVEGMAKAGKGNARYVVAGDRMEPIVMRMLKDALQPFLSDVKVDWGGAEVMELGGSSSEPAPPVVKPAAVKGSLMGHRAVTTKPELKIRELPTCMLQAPFKVPPIYSGTRFTVFALLRPDKLPSHITVTAQSPDGPLTLVMEVERHAGNMVQKLAARALIRDLEDGTSWFHEPHANQSPSAIKSEIIRLGTKYQLVSKHTSFIAVEHRHYHAPPPPAPITHSPAFAYSASPSYASSSIASSTSCSASPAPGGYPGGGLYGAQGYAAPPPPVGYAVPQSASFAAPAKSASYRLSEGSAGGRGGARSGGDRSSSNSMSFSKNSAAAPRKEVEKRKKSAAPSRSSQIDNCFSSDCDDEDYDLCQSSSLNSLPVKYEEKSFAGFSYHPPEPQSALPPPPPSSGSSSFLSSISNFFGGSAPPPPPAVAAGPPPPPSASAAPAPARPSAGLGSSPGGVFGQDALIALLLCQSFEGSFTENAVNLLTGLSAAQIKGAVPAGVDMSLWITLVVLAFLEIKVSSFQEQWEMNQRKAQKWAKSKTSDFASLQQQAKTFVSSN
eukprot:TRINITY_DN792_c0_g1_i12.p1 TRINITY_DN792_c0_g1~~TRINITY_DN792_c0_g1_i12.p1  ORF type:complete len:1013 (+),score=527.60 TRINITY_DN792_c0_g1_i12:72-3041(+)